MSMIHSSDEENYEDDENLSQGEEELIRVFTTPFSRISPNASLYGSFQSLVRTPNASPRASPTPSIQSSKSELADISAQEECERKEHLQLYVFVLRCIAYSFNAKQPTDMARRLAKVTRQDHHTIKIRFNSFLIGDTVIPSDEAFNNAVRAYYDIFVCSELVSKMVMNGGFTANDFRDVFKDMIEKRVRCLPEIDGLSKETVLSSWMAKFDAIYRGEDDLKKGTSRFAASASSELILSKEQLYEMFQTILGIKKYEHQILFNACQVRIRIVQYQYQNCA